MPAIIANHIKGRDIPSAWLKGGQLDPDAIFRIIIEPEKAHLSQAQRNRLLDKLEQLGGGEDSDNWIKEIKSARTRSELKVPFE